MMLSPNASSAPSLWYFDIVENALPSSTSAPEVRATFSVGSAAFLFKSFDAEITSHHPYSKAFNGSDPRDSRVEDGDVLFLRMVLVDGGLDVVEGMDEIGSSSNDCW